MFGFDFATEARRKSSSIFYLLTLVAFLMYTANLAATEQQKINIDITTHLGDVRDFKEGDRLSFLISLNVDAYVTVLYQDAKGEIIQILPNKKQANNFYKAGLFIALPDKASTFSFVIQAPFGRETLWAFAADGPLPELKGVYLKNGLKKLVGGVKAIKKSLAKFPKAAYGEARLELYTRARK